MRNWLQYSVTQRPMTCFLLPFMVCSFRLKTSLQPHEHRKELQPQSKILYEFEQIIYSQSTMLIRKQYHFAIMQL